MASTESWEVAAFDPEFQAAFAQAMGKPTGPELGLGGHGDGVQPKPYEKTLPCWELEFQEFLEAEDCPWEDSRLGLSPWENTEIFLASFQQVAQACRWPRKEWVTRLVPALDEEAEKAFRSLDEEDQHNFWKHFQQLENAALDYSKPKVSQEGRDLPWTQKINVDTSASRKSYPSRTLPWAQKAIDVDSKSSMRSYPNYDEVRRSRKRSLEREHSEPVKRGPKPRGRPPRASPYPEKQEWRRRSERLRRPSPSPPREEPRKKFRRASLPPETPRDRTKICPDCGQSCSGLSSFMRHQARHTGEKRYECCFCGRGFCWRSDLVRHETIHTGKKPHECQFCGEGFDRKWQRERHELGHAKVGRRL
ncbi:UNVERIFIED_CONTAM: hypothetical protein K2H54_062541 [Gekko kuhli]